jgi:alpha-beta hydrolase superfamily lysophospholipase
MTSAAPSAPARSDAPASWNPPSTVHTRGTLAVVAGRNESVTLYERFGKRLAADGYLVGVFEAADAGAAPEWLASQPAAPRVLVGSDAGAAAVLVALVAGVEVDGAVLVGTPVDVAADAEVAADSERTACSFHLGLLTDAASRSDRDVDVTLPERAELAAVEVPVLVVHGGADTVAPIAATLDYLSPLPGAEALETVGGLHDALNDQSHRSVAAHIVLWLERLRSGDAGAQIVRVAA